MKKERTSFQAEGRDEKKEERGREDWGRTGEDGAFSALLFCGSVHTPDCSGVREKNVSEERLEADQTLHPVKK